MKKILSASILSIFLVGLISSPALCQNAKDIIEKFIDAQGGREALAAVKDSTISGSMQIIQMGIEGQIAMYQKEPNKMRMEMEFMGMTQVQAYDGETGWYINPQTGATEEMTDEMASEIRRDAIGNSALLYPEKFGITYEYKGTETIEGKDYLAVEQTFDDGNRVSMYIDPESYLLYKTKGKSLNQMGVEVETESVLSDYKKVEGIMTPHSITIYQDGEEFLTMDITEVDYNTGLKDSFFKMTE
ncbi:MAG: hypothetical protein ACOC5F_00670 [Candidatus Aminicenantaceae bacterium]